MTFAFILTWAILALGAVGFLLEPKTHYGWVVCIFQEITYIIYGLVTFPAGIAFAIHGAIFGPIFARNWYKDHRRPGNQLKKHRKPCTETKHRGPVVVHNDGSLTCRRCGKTFGDENDD